MAILGQPVAADAARSGHLGGVDSGTVNPLYVEQYGNEVEHQFLKDSIMRQYYNVRSVRGTDTIGSRRIGNVTLQAVSRSTRPTDNAPDFDNIQLKIDTIVLARSNVFLLEEFQESIDTRKEIGVEHGKEIGKFFDEAFVIQAIKAAQVTNVAPDGTESGGWAHAVAALHPYVNLTPGSDITTSTAVLIKRSAPVNFKGGNVVVLDAVGDELVPDDLVSAIHRMCQMIEEKDVTLDDGIILVRPAQFYALLESDKLINKDFSTGNGDYAAGTVMKVNGIRIATTNRFAPIGSAADAAGTHHLSNAGNANAYDRTLIDNKAVAVFISSKSLLAGETIPLTSKVYYSDVELQWFIDSYLSFGVTPNRVEGAGAVFQNAADNL